jgi:hypothetical protein
MLASDHDNEYIMTPPSCVPISTAPAREKNGEQAIGLCTASGQVATAQPRSVANSRRLIAALDAQASTIVTAKTGTLEEAI